MLALLGRELLVGSGVHELLKVLQALLSNLNLGDPATPVRVVLSDLVDGARLLLQEHVDLGDLARDSGVDVGSALDRLDGTNGVASLHLLALFRQLDVDDVAQLLGGVLADAQDARLLIRSEIDPLVLLGVLPYRIYSLGRPRLARAHTPRFLKGLSSLVAVTEKARTPIVREAEFLTTAERAAGRATLKQRAIEAMAKDLGGCWEADSCRLQKGVTQIRAGCRR